MVGVAPPPRRVDGRQFCHDESASLRRALGVIVTVGSLNYDNFTQVDTNTPWSTHGWYGTKGSKTWSGGDRTRVDYPKSEIYTVYRDGKTYRFPRLNRLTSRPPKRQRDEEHAYSLNLRLQEQDLVTYFSPTIGGVNRTRGRVDTFGVTDWGPTPLLTANDQLKLLGKLREKLQGSEFNLARFLGEGHQALEMIGGTAIKLAKAYRHLRKGDIAGTAKSLLEGTSRAPLKPYQQKWVKPTAANLSSHWLELQYGWLPLIKDVQAGAEFLAHQLSVPLQTTYRMSVRREQTQTRFTQLDPGNAGVTSTASRYHQRFLKVIVSEHPTGLASLGLLDPSIVAWELLPWSFVADWFIPIGSYLEARAVTSMIVAKYVTTDKTYGRTFPIDGGVYFPKAAYTFKQLVLTRTVSAAPKLPFPEFKPLSKVASWQHCANAVALLVGGFAGKGSKGY